MRRRYLLPLLLMGVSGGTSAHELYTHGLLTQETYSYSQLGSNMQLINDLGLTEWVKDLGSRYYDWDSTSDFLIVRPTNNDFEAPIINAVLSVPLTSIQGWLMRGAIREDDYPDNPPATDSGDSNFGSGLYRPLNHFFDPGLYPFSTYG